MNSKRRIYLRNAIALMAPFGATRMAPAQSAAWPQRPLRIITGGPAGGTSDILARIVGDHVTRSIGQPWIVDNKPGAGGLIGAELTAKSVPDGYTFMLNTIASHGISPMLYKKVGFDADKEVAGVSLLAVMPNVLYVRKDSPFQTVRELVSYAKANPGKLNFATSGLGATTHLSIAMLGQIGGVDIVTVPYKGSSAAVQAMLGGEVQASFENLIAVISQIKAGTVRALAVTTAVRSPQLPEVPTMSEAGIPGYDLAQWSGLVAPAGTPKAVLDQLSTEIGKALGDPEVAARIRAGGAEPMALPTRTFDDFMRSERVKWAKVVKSAQLSAD